MCNVLETLKEIDKLDLQHKQIKGVTRQYGNMGAIDFETPKQSLTFIKKMREAGYILEDGSENVSTAVFCLPFIFKDHDLFESNRMYHKGYVEALLYNCLK